MKNILIIERENCLGGILRQCIHDGFGLGRFGESLSGPEYAERFISEVEKNKIPYMINAAVTEITKEKKITVVAQDGMHEIEAKAVILAMGCRERPRGALNIPGYRPAGIYSRNGAGVHEFIQQNAGKGSGDPRLRRYWNDHGAPAYPRGSTRSGGI